MPDKTHQSVTDLIETFIKKAEDEEKAASNLDLAGDAKSTHPSANVDDKTKPATEGSRSSENESDVRKDVPDTINDESSKNTDEGEAATVNGDMGMETMDAESGLKGNVDKPKKDHSQSMSDSGPGDGGESFKGDWDKASSATSLAGEANKLLADLTLLTQGSKSAAETEIEIEKEPGKEPKVSIEKEASDEEEKEDDEEKEAGDNLVALYKQAAQQFPEDVEAGYTAAALLAQHLGLIKDASADEANAKAVELIQKEASADATQYADFLRGFAESTKQAAGMDDPAALAALGNAGEGEAAGGEMGGGGADIGAMLAGAGGGEAGGMPGAEMMGGEMGGGDEEAIIEALAQALDEAGVTPEDLAEAVAAEGGEGGGEMEEEGAEMAGGEGEGGEAEAAAPEAGGETGEKYSSAKGSGIKKLSAALTRRLGSKKK